MAGVVIEVIAVATPALSMSAIDFSGVQSRTGPRMFRAVIAARYGGGVWWWWTSILCGCVVAIWASASPLGRSTVAPSAATLVRNSRLTMNPSCPDVLTDITRTPRSGIVIPG